jgi:Flp pilus assembly protein TadG
MTVSAKSFSIDAAGRLARWRADATGAAAVEFALIVPVLLVLYLAGYEVSQVVSTYRKVCDTTAQLANIVTQETAVTKASLTTYMDATSQIMAPYPTANLKVVVSQINVNYTTNAATVGWSEAYQGGTANTAGATWSLPAKLINAGNTTNYSYILVQSSYTYTPQIGAAFMAKSYPMSNQLYMAPRQVATIPCSDC